MSREFLVTTPEQAQEIVITGKIVYEKPLVEKLRVMNFPFHILSAKKENIICKQCSSCHGCR